MSSILFCSILFLSSMEFFFYSSFYPLFSFLVLISLIFLLFLSYSSLLFSSRLHPLYFSLHPSHLSSQGLCKTARTGAVGIYNNACLLFQDSLLYGPYSPEALRCGELFTIAMDSHKTGLLASDTEGLNDRAPKTPFYLEKGDNKRFDESVCKKSRILGHIYALVEEYKIRLTQESAVRVDFELDQDFLPDDPSLQDADDSKVVCEWQQHLLDYKAKRLRLMTNGDSGDKAAFQRIQDLYRNLFEASVETMKQRILPTLQLHCKISSINDGLRDHAIFLCRRHIALLIYMVTYHNEKMKEKAQKLNFSFCWDICASELHAIKLEKMLKKNNQNKNDIILASQRSFL
jgi:hypothetical protein